MTVLLAVKRIPDCDIATRLERRLLNVFWSAVRQQPDERLALLLDFTRLVVHRSDDWDQRVVRTEHATRSTAAVKVHSERCFSCESRGQLYRHHIIEVQNGGSNAVRNQVPLCFDCHQFLHPWLTDDDRIGNDKPSTGFESLGQIMARQSLPASDQE